MLHPEADEGVYRYTAQTQLTLAAIQRATGELLMWHAAGLCTTDGRVLGLLGPSGTGKTTAAAYLGTRGFGYVTDETLAVTPDGQVVPYPKPLAHRTADPVKGSLGPDELGLGVPAGSLRLHRLVLLVRPPAGADGADRARMAPLAPLDALLELVGLSSGLTMLPAPLATLARTLDRTMGVVVVSYTDISAAAPLLADLVESAPFPETTDWEWEHLGIDGPSMVDVEAADPGGPVVWRGSYLDAIATAEEVLLLAGPVPVRLAGIGATLWLALDQGRSEAELTAHLQEVHGAHPQAAEIVAATVAELVELGVLVRGHRRGP